MNLLTIKVILGWSGGVWGRVGRGGEGVRVWGVRVWGGWCGWGGGVGL